MAAKKAKARKASRPEKKATVAKKNVVAKKPATKKKAIKQMGKKAAAKTPTVKQAAVKQVAEKTAVRKTAKPRGVARKAVAARPPVTKPIISPNRPSWVDELTQTPLIDDYAHQLESFISAMADGRVDGDEIKSQEQRVVGLLKEIDPQLDDTLHAKVTQLLCELTAFAIMQMLYAVEQTRPQTVFQG